MVKVNIDNCFCFNGDIFGIYLNKQKCCLFSCPLSLIWAEFDWLPGRPKR